jgi:hypothetical protein
MIKLLYIATINRHGGSLLNRLLDSHSEVGTLPLEMGFPPSRNAFDFMEKLSGYPTSVPNLETFDGSILKLFGLDQNLEPIYEWGKERSDKIGVRKNYLEKAFYDDFKTDFNRDQFIEDLKNKEKLCNNTNDVYKSYFESYFKNWDEAKYKKDFKYYVLHSSGGLCLDNYDEFFKVFPNSYVLIPVRDPVTYIASEKVRLARIFLGSRRFYKPVPPDFLVKFFDYYDINALIRCWNVSITRYRILQEKYKDQFFFYRYEDLVNKTKETMTELSRIIDIKYDDILLKPTLAGNDWGGNSHKGRLSKVELSNYASKVLRKSEIKKIKEKTSILDDIIKLTESSSNIDYTRIDDNKFYQYKIQKEISSHKMFLITYLAFAMNGARKKKISKVGLQGIIAFFFGLFVRIFNIPRLFKQKYFPSRGKQNYT